MAWNGVLFDMDGVLCDSEPFICQAACRMFREQHGVTVRPEDFQPFVGTGENRYLGGVATHYGVRFDQEADKARTYAIYLELIRGRLQPLAGVRSFITACQARGLRLALASSADAVKVRGNLAELGLPPDTFATCVDGLMVARRKPAPDLFLLAAERLGLSPLTCLVVEDAPSGLVAARAAGCRALGICSSFAAEELRDAGAEWIACDLSEALPLIETITRAFTPDVT